jgi:hypothetical protein
MDDRGDEDELEKGYSWVLIKFIRSDKANSRLPTPLGAAKFPTDEVSVKPCKGSFQISV